METESAIESQNPPKFLDTRNPSPEQIREYETCLRAKEVAELDIEEFANAISENYDVPPGLDVDLLTGTFLASNKPLTGSPQMSEADRLLLWKLQVQAKKARTALKRCTVSMKQICDAPNFAQLDTNYRWVTPQGQLLVKVAPPTPPRKSDEECRQVE